MESHDGERRRASLQHPVGDPAGVVTTQSFNDAGTFRLNGTTATLQFNSDGTTGTGTLTGNTLTVAAGGFTSIYTKQ